MINLTRGKSVRSAVHPIVEEMSVVRRMMNGTSLILLLLYAVTSAGCSPALPDRGDVGSLGQANLPVPPVGWVLPTVHYQHSVHGPGVGLVPGELKGRLLAGAVVTHVHGQEPLVRTHGEAAVQAQKKAKIHKNLNISSITCLKESFYASRKFLDYGQSLWYIFF